MRGRRTVVIDIGNTSTVAALARDGAIERPTRVSTHAVRHSDILATLRRVTGGRATGAVICSVVPGAEVAWQRVLDDSYGLDPHLVSCRSPLGVAIDYPRPTEIGADRLANAAGAAERYGAPVIVADCGTALTFDVVTRARAYVGGVIVPGAPLMTEYLWEKTALLPRIDLRPTDDVIGRSTVGAMRAGAQLGYRGIMREVTTALRRELGGGRVQLVGTGGYIAWALRGSGLRYRIDPWITLHGLDVIEHLVAAGHSAKRGMKRK